MSESDNSQSPDTAELNRVLRANLPPQALNTEWTEEQILDLLNNGRKLRSLSTSLIPVLEVLKRILGTISASGYAPEHNPVVIGYGAIGRLVQLVTERPSFVAPTNKLLESVYAQLKPIEQCPSFSSEPRAVLTSARILNLFAVALAYAQEFLTTKIGSQFRAFGGPASTDMLTSDDTIIATLRKLGWFVEDLEWLSYDQTTMIAIAWARGKEKFEKCRGSAGAPVTQLEISSFQDIVSQLEEASATPMGKETKRLREAVKKLGSDIESLLQEEAGEQRRVVYETVANCVASANGNKAAVSFVSNVFVDLQKYLPKVEASAATSELSNRLLVHIIDHLGIAVTELHNYDSRWTINKVTGLKKSLAKASDALHESFLKLDHLKSIFRAQSYRASHPQASITKFEEMWNEAIADYTKDTGKDPTQLTTDVTSLDDLKETITQGEHEFIRSRTPGSEIREGLDPIVRFLSRHTALVGEFGAGLGFEQTKVISTAISLLFESAKAVSASYDQVEELLRRISEIVVRVETYSPDRLRPQLREVLVEELCHVLHILGIATKGVQRSEKFMKALANQKDEVQTALTKLKELIEKERGIVGALTLRTVEDIHGKVEDIRHILRPFVASQGPGKESRTLRKVAIPPPSACFLGRDTETVAAIESVLKFESSVICGPGGIGKTSLSLQVLHDEQVQRHFQGRYFVRCDGTPTLDLLYTEIADCFGIPVIQRDAAQVKEQILDSLRNTPTLLCFDNFETLWDLEQTRFDVEQALKSFVDLPSTAVLVTMRGTREPGSIHWSYPLSKSLQPLTPSDAFALFREHSKCDQDDPYAHRLVEAMESIPLAIVLLAYQARGEDETTEELWHRLEKYGTSVVSRGESGGRLLDLNTSIELSLNGPRMRSSPLARQTLALLSLLPSGLDKNGEIFEELCKMEVLNRLHDSLRLLSDTALAFLDSSLSGRRYRVLAPISRFSRQHLLPLLPASIQKHVLYTYTQFMEDRTPWNPEHHMVVPSELANSHSILQFALDCRLATMPDLIEGILSQTLWMDFFGSSSADFLLLAIQDSTLDDSHRGDCLQLLGEVYNTHHDLDAAESSFIEAVKLHQKAHNVKSEGRDRKMLGELYLRENRLLEAETSLLHAMKLHQQVCDSYGKGNVMGRLGELYLRQNRLKEAETSLLDALKLHQQVYDVLSEGTDRLALGKVYLQQNRLEEAEKFLIDATKLHQQAHDLTSEGSDRETLGEIYLRKNQLEEAETSLSHALRLFKQTDDVYGEGNIMGRLGELYLRQGRLQEAEISLLDAVKLHQRAQSVLGEGADRSILGKVYLRQNRLEEAEASLLEAVKLHEQTHDNNWIKHGMSLLEELYALQKLAEAERVAQEEELSDSESIGTTTTDEQYLSCDSE